MFKVIYPPKITTSAFPLLHRLKESPEVDINDVHAKLKSSYTSSKYDTASTCTYGFEDTSGQIIKVRIPNDERKDFEEALAMELSAANAMFDKTNTEVEIAEILFALKDKFDIIDVEWPTIPEEDEENIEPVEPDVEAESSDEEVDPEATPEDVIIPEDPEPEISADSQTSADTILLKLLDLMTQQASAQQAQASADKAKYARDIAAQKMQQEEQILDMEALEDAEAKRKKEATKMLKLAKFRQQIASGDVNTSQ